MAIENVFGNLKLLKKDMEDKGWCIDSFLFNYNQRDYIVLIKLYTENEEKPDYALLKIEFLKQENHDDSLLVAANSVKLFVDAKTLREYFNIQYRANLGDILQEFNKYFALFIPTKVIDNKTEVQKRAMIKSLSISDSEDPNKIYCYKVRRNPNRSNRSLGQRSEFNDNKTRILRPILYQRLKAETNLSFCFSKNQSEENSDETIIYNWTKNKIKVG